jgi:hypothetical protein
MPGSRGDGFEQRLRGFLVGLAEGRIGQHTGNAVDPLRGDGATAVAGLQLLEQLGLLLRLARF